MQQGRWRALIAVSRPLVADPPKVPNMTMPVDQMAQENIIRGYEQLHDDDGVLREGETYLAKYPASMTIGVVRMWMNNAINHKHAVTDGVQGAAAALAKLPPAERDDPCKRAQVYADNEQKKDAKRSWIACDAKGGPPHWPPGNLAVILARMALDTNDVALMKSSMARLQKENPQQYRQLQFWETLVSDE
jgi:hypothetical protein